MESHPIDKPKNLVRRFVVSENLRHQFQTIPNNDAAFWAAFPLYDLKELLKDSVLGSRCLQRRMIGGQLDQNQQNFISYRLAF